MGRRSPASSCLRIIVCSGGDDAVEPSSNSLENKSFGDKRGWSFRKKSEKRELIMSSLESDTITTPTSRARETLESALLNPQSPENKNVFSVQSFDEKKNQSAVISVAEPVDEKIAELPVLVESKGTETEDDDIIGTEVEAANAALVASVIEKDITSKVEQDESETEDVIIIRRESDEEADGNVDESVVIIIQAAIRRFLARREVLRRKKVIKLQAAVRGHLVRNHAMGSLRCVQAIVKMQTLVRARHSRKDGSHVSAILDKAETNASAQKLLENKFAKHLMESAAKTKPISIKCDPTKPSSAWNWLERWLSVSKPEKTSKTDLTTEEPQLEETQNVKGSTLETKTETGLSSYEASKRKALHVELSETEKISQYDSLLVDPESVDDQLKHSLKRKASNPSFIAALSKFEEVTTSSGSNKATTLPSKVGALGDEGKTDIDSKHDHSDIAPADLSGSESGTELSVTLDSLDKKSDVEGTEPKFEKGSIKTGKAEIIEIDVKDETPLGSVEDPKEKAEDEVINTPDSKKRRAEDESGHQVSNVSLTPITVAESEATPASQASSSVKAKKGNSGKSSSSQKRKVSKKITSSPKQEAVTGRVNTTTEQQEEKEQKSGRRNSFGLEQEARESSGGKNSLPRFMQPTQSAKAKVQEHNSPRSSPDLQERDIASVKKRHSLPTIANGKQDSSHRIQRSASQTQQTTKDRKWQR